MKGTMIIIKPDSKGPDDVEAVELTGPPELERLHNLLHGHIEVVPLFNTFHRDGKDHPCVVFCNEEGKLHGLPINGPATIMWDRALRKHHRPSLIRMQDSGAMTMVDVLVGDIVVITGDKALLDSL